MNMISKLTACNNVFLACHEKLNWSLDLVPSYARLSSAISTCSYPSNDIVRSAPRMY